MKAKKKFMTVMSLIIVACLLFAVAAACDQNKDVAVTSVTLDRATLTLEIGQKQTLSALVMPNNATDKAERWVSSNPSVATVNNGLVTAVAEGTAAIKVTIGGKSATCNVTVVDNSGQAVPVTGVTLNKTVLKLDTSSNPSEKLTAIIEPLDATNQVVTWKSFDTNVATVSADGTVTAKAGGTVLVQATVARIAGSDITFKGTCVVQVEGDVADNDVLYVGKVSSLSNRSQGFIMGMDASAVPSIEAARKASDSPLYKDFDGVEKDVFEILADNGITDIRIRVWNDPTDADGNTYGGGNCDIDNAVEIAARCKEAGLGVIIDFHYSDFWADPGKQTVPKAWQGKSTSEIETLIYDFTAESLNAIKATGVKITMVQIGNETTRAICGAVYDSAPAVYCAYINAGSRAVREVTGTVANGGAKVAVHFTNPESRNYVNYAKTFADNKVDYDVFGSSYYPYWHGTLANLSAKLKAVHDAYDKEVMVLETSYAFTKEDFDGAGNTALDETPYPITVQGQANAVRSVIETIANLGDWGLGVCYWEGTWIAASDSPEAPVNTALCKQYGSGWASSYAKNYDKDATDGGCVVDDQAFWNSVTGMPNESLKVFKLVYTGQTTSLKADEIVAQEDYYTVGIGSIELPSQVDITLNNGSTMKVAAYWAVTAEQLDEYIRKVDTYTILGTTEYSGTCVFTAWVMNPNLIDDGSFEADQGVTGYGSTDKFIQSSGLGNWKLTYTKASTGDLQLYVSNDSGNARMGSQSFHFWDSGVVNFTLSQTIDLSKLADYGNGKYTCSFDMMGGNADDMDIYAYIKVTYKDGSTETTVNGNKIYLTKWQDWKRTSASVDIADLSNVATIEMGITVKAGVLEGSEGPWGNIDNAQFYFG